MVLEHEEWFCGVLTRNKYKKSIKKFADNKYLHIGQENQTFLRVLMEFLRKISLENSRSYYLLFA